MLSALLCRALRRRAALGLSACATAVALTLTPVLPPGVAVARPAAAADTAAQGKAKKPPAPKPRGKQITKWFQDPVGNMAYQARKRAGLGQAYGRNLAIGFVDITGLDDVDTTGYDVVEAGELKQNDPALYKSLGLAERPQIERFVIVPTFNNPSTGNVDGAHSEIRFFSQELKYMRVEDPARTFLLYSDLSPCDGCAPKIPANTEVRWMTKQGKGSFQRRERILNAAATAAHDENMTDADRERNAKAVARSRQQVLDKRAREAERLANLWGKAPSAPCATPQAAPLPAGGAGVLARAASRYVVAADCGEPDDKAPAQGAPSGLGRALAGPVAQAPGGIDFSALQLRYLSDPGDGSGLQYSFEAPASTTGGASPTDGTNAARLSSDAFFVWLELNPSTFWVNLNPTEPDRIVDADMGRTDVGRVMLQADLRLKKDVGRLIHPATELGKEYHDRLQGTCSSSRVWIVPDPADVRADGDKLYILKAPLKVRMESEYIRLPKGQSELGNCPKEDDATRRHNESLFRSLVLPKLTQLVNTDAHYADLRRVYLSRVAAQWYRDLSVSRHTTYRDLVDHGDINSWTTRTGWKPRDTFDRYVRSYTKGDYHYTRKETKGNTIYTYTYVYGGVDLTSVPLRKLSDSSFAARYSDLAKDIRASLTSPAGGAQAAGADDPLWLGSGTPRQAAAEHGSSEDGDGTGKPVADGGPGGSGPGLPTAWVLPPALLVLLAAVLLWRRRRRPSASGGALPSRRPTAGTGTDRPRSPYDDYL
ncbi:hypothetical protein ACFZCP_30635 [Streptomyces sp. NPDC007971]|uniref:hypothetical protein n=1 Tax=Streptomyces sp. NPDC007971 TaxID=3364799 RepID=UPI0036E3EBA3